MCKSFAGSEGAIMQLPYVQGRQSQVLYFVTQFSRVKV